MNPAAWFREFFARRGGGGASLALRNHGKVDEAEVSGGVSTLSLVEIDPGLDVQAANEHELLAVIAVPTGDTLSLRFVTPAAMRAAGRNQGGRWLINDVVVTTSVTTDRIGLLLYRIRFTPRLDRLLAAVENMVVAHDAAPDGDRDALAHAALERIEVLEGEDGAKLLLAGSAVTFGEPDTSPAARDDRYLAVLGDRARLDELGPLCLVDRRLHRGADPASAEPLERGPYLLLRLGSRSTRQSVREFIDEIRRRHQRRAAAGGAGSVRESFDTFVARFSDGRRQATINETYGHHQMLPVVTPVAIEADDSLESLLVLGTDPPTPFQQKIDDLRAALFGTYGVRIPGLRLRINTSGLPEGTYILMLNEVPLVSGNLSLKKRLCLATRAQLGGIPAEEAVVPDGTGREASWISAEREGDARALGFATADAADYLLLHLRGVLIDNLHMFATLDDLAGRLGDSPADLPGGLVGFVEVLRTLLMEGLPIGALTALKDRYVELLREPGASPIDVAEHLRLVPEVSSHLLSDISGWRVYDVDPAFETQISAGIVRDGAAAVLALEPEQTAELLTSVRSTLADKEGAHNVVIINDWRVRPFVRSLMSLEFPRLRVVARREVASAAGLPPVTATIEGLS